MSQKVGVFTLKSWCFVQWFLHPHASPLFLMAVANWLEDHHNAGCWLVLLVCAPASHTSLLMHIVEPFESHTPVGGRVICKGISCLDASTRNPCTLCCRFYPNRLSRGCLGLNKVSSISWSIVKSPGMVFEQSNQFHQAILLLHEELNWS